MKKGIYSNVGIWLIVFLVSSGRLAGCLGGRSADEGNGHGSQAARRSGPATDEQRNAEIRAKLARRTDAAFIETPFDQVLDFLSDAVDVQFHVKGRVLDKLAFLRDFPVTSTLGGCHRRDRLGTDPGRRAVGICRRPRAGDRLDARRLQAKMVVRTYRLQTVLPDLATSRSTERQAAWPASSPPKSRRRRGATVEVGAFPASVGAGAPPADGRRRGMGMVGAAMPAGGAEDARHRRSGQTGGISVLDRVLIVRNSIKVHDEVEVPANVGRGEGPPCGKSPLIVAP